MKNTLYDADLERLLTLDEAAHLLALNPTTLSRAIAAQRLTAYNVGTELRPRWRIAPADLKAWLESTDGGRRD